MNAIGPQLEITADKARARQHRVNQRQKMLADHLKSIEELASKGKFHLNLSLPKPFAVDTGVLHSSSKFADENLIALVRAQSGQEDLVFLLESLLNLGYHFWTFPSKPGYADNLAADRVMDNVQVNWESFEASQESPLSAHLMHMKAKKARELSNLLTAIGHSIQNAADEGKAVTRYCVPLEQTELLPSVMTALENNGFVAERSMQPTTEWVVTVRWGVSPLEPAVS